MSSSPGAPRTLPALLDQSIVGPLVLLTGEVTPLDELDQRIAHVPQLAPLRDLHALFPRLVANPRDPELEDPFLALYRLAICLADRVEGEFQTDTLWLWQLVRHRAECGQHIPVITQAIGFEAKRRAAQVGLRTDAVTIINRLITVILALSDWRTEAKPEPSATSRQSHQAATEQYWGYLRDTMGPTGEAFELLAVDVHTREEVARRAPDQDTNRLPGKDDAGDPRHKNPTVAAAFAVVKQQKGRGLYGKAIVSRLKQKSIVIGEAAFRRHIVAELKLLGVKNHRSRGGYYYDPAA